MWSGSEEPGCAMLNSSTWLIPTILDSLKTCCFIFKIFYFICNCQKRIYSFFYWCSSQWSTAVFSPRMNCFNRSLLDQGGFTSAHSRQTKSVLCFSDDSRLPYVLQHAWTGMKWGISATTCHFTTRCCQILPLKTVHRFNTCTVYRSVASV